MVEISHIVSSNGRSSNIPCPSLKALRNIQIPLEGQCQFRPCENGTPLQVLGIPFVKINHKEGQRYSAFCTFASSWDLVHEVASRKNRLSMVEMSHIVSSIGRSSNILCPSLKALRNIQIPLEGQCQFRPCENGTSLKVLGFPFVKINHKEGQRYSAFCTFASSWDLVHEVASRKNRLSMVEMSLIVSSIGRSSNIPCPSLKALRNIQIPLEGQCQFRPCENGTPSKVLGIPFVKINHKEGQKCSAFGAFAF